MLSVRCALQSKKIPIFKGISLGIQRKREGCYEYGQDPEEFGEEKG